MVTLHLSLSPSYLSVLAVVGMTTLALAQVAPWPLSPFSTHDRTDPSTVLPESCADVKTPGNGRTYMVGTIGVTNTVPSITNPPMFSGTQIASPPVNLGSHWSSGLSDTAFLQCSDATGILWQTYFYGRPPNFGGFLNNFFGSRSTARAVSVYAMPSEADTRIAICGESFDESIPGDSNARQNYWTNGGLTSGYIAVFNGGGQLLWSRLIFASSSSSDDRTVITDVSIRVETIGGQNFDVVTYCGVTTAGATIGPVSAFPPTRPHPFGNQVVAGGATHNGLTGSLAGNWDGLIGREWADPNDPRRFRALVGGGYQDGLFGIAEIDSHRFAVVGTSASLGSPPSSPCSGTPCPYEFPLTDWTTFNDSTPFISDQQAFHFQLGVLAIVDATATRSGGSLIMERSELLGSRSIQGASLRHTVARDVACLGNNLLVVGSTDDPLFTQPFGTPAAIPGPVSGYVLLAKASVAGAKLHAIYLSGNGGRGEAVGIAGWSEYPDHATVVSRYLVNQPDQNLMVSKVLVDTTLGAGAPKLVKLLSENVHGSDFETVAELPAGAGTLNMYPRQALLWPTTSSGSSSYQFGQVLGDPFGGGVCADSRGRGTIAGTTFSHDYPVSGLGRAVSVWTSPNVNCDGVRTEIDLLPSGACRTDGTSGLFPPPFVRASGDGGTTPAAALPPFGLQILGNVPGPIRRMMIDLDGKTFAGAAASILVDRPPPPAVSPGYGTFLQIGPPLAIPIAIAGMPGVEVWTTNSPVFTYYAPHDGTLRVPLWPTGLPSGSWTFALQFFAAYPGSYPFAATPALVITY